MGTVRSAHLSDSDLHAPARPQRQPRVGCHGGLRGELDSVAPQHAREDRFRHPERERPADARPRPEAEGTVRVPCDTHEEAMERLVGWLKTR